MRKFFASTLIFCALSPSSGAQEKHQTGPAWIIVNGDSEGQQVYKKWCVACHTDEPFAAGTAYLRTVKPENAVIANNRDLRAEYIEYMVRHGRGGMPSFRKTEISKLDLNELTKYLIGDAPSAKEGAEK